MIDRGLKENGKRDLVFASTVSSNLALSADELKRKYGDRLVPVPCGRCIGCALDRSKDWAVRCVLESLSYEKNCFLTLTFDELHVPETVSKKDVQLFLKRLRKSNPGIEIRYFACGEYGSKSGRPHYHLILFNYDFDDKKFYSSDGLSDYYVSESLAKLWPFGMSIVGDLSFESCAYVARYTSKKVGSNGGEFLLMSRRPGLGSRWFHTHSDLVYVTDKIYSKFGASHIAHVPRYFDKLAEEKNIDLTVVKEDRVRIANNIGDLQRYLYHQAEQEEMNLLSDCLTALKVCTLRRRI